MVTNLIKERSVLTIVSDTPLKILGLTDYEEKAYLTLARLGVCRASELAKESQIPRQKIYEILENLNNKGFVNTVQDKVTLYSPINPIFIEKLLMDKFENAKTFLASLHETAGTKHKDNIWIIRGKSRINSMLYQFTKALKAEKSLYIIANNLSLVSRASREIVKLKKKSVDVKIIANNEPQTRSRAEVFTKNNIDMKFIDSKHLKARAGVYDDKSAIVWDEESMIFSDSEFFVNFIRDHFKLLWSVGKKEL